MDERFYFWQPPAGHTITTGPEQSLIFVPEIPIPLLVEPSDETPADQELGKGVYAYLRQFPDCEHAREYAQLLKEGYSHFLADLASQAVMLNHKQVDSPYLHRQINCLKILALLEPENAGLQGQLGITLYQLALMFQELPLSRKHLLQALGYFNRATKLGHADAGIANYLAHVNYLIGDYPVALQRWQQALANVANDRQRQQLEQRIGRLERWDVPDYPLCDDLEQVGQALEFYSAQKFGPAVHLLEQVSARGLLLEEFSMPEFYYLEGLCYEGLGDVMPARDAFRKAVTIDPDFQPALEKLPS